MDQFSRVDGVYKGEGERSSRRLNIPFDTKEEAIAFVKDFWNAHEESQRPILPEGMPDEDWVKGIECGDRTSISPGRGVRNNEDPSKWYAKVDGYDQPLTRDATRWLKGKGLL